MKRTYRVSKVDKARSVLPVFISPLCVTSDCDKTFGGLIGRCLDCILLMVAAQCSVSVPKSWGACYQWFWSNQHETSLGVSTVGAGGVDKESVIGLLRKEGLGAAGMRGTTRDRRGENQMGVKLCCMYADTKMWSPLGS